MNNKLASLSAIVAQKPEVIPANSGRNYSKRIQPTEVVSTAVQLNLFQFHEQGHLSNKQLPNQSVELGQTFRKQLFREPFQLLQSLPKLTVLERRLYWLVLGALKNYQYLHQVTPTSLPLLQQRLSFQFHRSRLRATKDDNSPVNISVTEVKKTLVSLSQKSIQWENTKGDLVSVHMFDTQYLMGEGLMILELNPKLTEAFLKLGNDFAQFNLNTALQLQKEYSQLLYSYFSRHQWRGKWIVNVSDFRTQMEIPATGGSYDRFTNLKQRVIDPAIKEIQALGELSVSYDTIIVNRIPTHIQFTITSTASKSTATIDSEKEARLAQILSEIDSMSFPEKISFAVNTLTSYYPKLQEHQRDSILSDRTLLDQFLRADAYVEAGLVQKDKHDAYVATSVFGGKLAKSKPN